MVENLLENGKTDPSLDGLLVGASVTQYLTLCSVQASSLWATRKKLHCCQTWRLNWRESIFKIIFSLRNGWISQHPASQFVLHGQTQWGCSCDVVPQTFSLSSLRQNWKSFSPVFTALSSYEWLNQKNLGFLSHLVSHPERAGIHVCTSSVAY